MKLVHTFVTKTFYMIRWGVFCFVLIQGYRNFPTGIPPMTITHSSKRVVDSKFLVCHSAYVKHPREQFC